MGRSGEAPAHPPCMYASCRRWAVQCPRQQGGGWSVGMHGVPHGEFVGQLQTCSHCAATPPACRNCRARLEQHNSRRRKVFVTAQSTRRSRYNKDKPLQVGRSSSGARLQGLGLADQQLAWPVLSSGLARVVHLSVPQPDGPEVCRLCGLWAAGAPAGGRGRGGRRRGAHGDGRGAAATAVQLARAPAYAALPAGRWACPRLMVHTAQLACRQVQSAARRAACRPN